MSLKPFKFVVQAIVIEEQGGAIVGERQSEPQTFYQAEMLKEWLDRFLIELSEDGGNPRSEQEEE